MTHYSSKVTHFRLSSEAPCTLPEADRLTLHPRQLGPEVRADVDGLELRRRVRGDRALAVLVGERAHLGCCTG